MEDKGEFVRTNKTSGGRTHHVSYATRVAIEAILDERLRQDKLKEEGRFKYTCADQELSFTDCMMVLMEEVGELCRAHLEASHLTFDRLADHVEGKVGEQKVAEECTQVAAVALAMLERFVVPPLHIPEETT